MTRDDGTQAKDQIPTTQTAVGVAPTSIGPFEVGRVHSYCVSPPLTRDPRPIEPTGISIVKRQSLKVAAILSCISSHLHH